MQTSVLDRLNILIIRSVGSSLHVEKYAADNTAEDAVQDGDVAEDEVEDDDADDDDAKGEEDDDVHIEEEEDDDVERG